jgi:hypothetical protein
MAVWCPEAARMPNPEEVPADESERRARSEAAGSASTRAEKTGRLARDETAAEPKAGKTGRRAKAETATTRVERPARVEPATDRADLGAKPVQPPARVEPGADLATTRAVHPAGATLACHQPPVPRLSYRAGRRRRQARPWRSAC